MELVYNIDVATKFRELDIPDIPVPVRQLIVGTRLPCDFFIDENSELKLFFSRDVIYTKISQDILKEKGISEVYIYMKDAPAFDFYLSANRSSHQSPDVDSKAAFREYAFRKEQYLQIDPSLLTPGTKINFSVCMLDRFDFVPLVNASDNSPAEVDEGMLKVAGDIVIKRSDIPRYKDYIAALQKGEPSENDKARINSLAIRESSKVVLMDLLSDPRSGEKMKEVDVAVNEMIDCILDNRDAIYMLLSIKGYDYYTYTHSVNVAALSIGLGIAINLDRVATEKLGMGAMLHDIGKSAISHEILNKQGKLDEIEFNIMKSHVVEGEKIMRDRKDFPEDALCAITQHHEKLSYKGYPNGLGADGIKLFGRITGIADCYDALTTRRPYRIAFSPFNALKIISKETSDYDAELLKIFIKMLGKIK